MKNVFFIAIIVSSCTTPKGYQSNKPFVFKNTIDFKGGKFSGEERNNLKQRFYTLLDDSMKTQVKDFIFLFHTIRNPPAYDSAYAAASARNMKSTLTHMGYYRATDSFSADTNKLTVLTYRFPFKIKKAYQERVSVKYFIDAGDPILIDTFSYNLKKPELQQLAEETKNKSLLVESEPVTKAAVLGETGRLVELYRNNGYYKFTPDDLKVLGDTTVGILTNISDDPFENIRQLAEANQKRDKPTIKLAMILNPVADTNHLKKFYINNIIISPDFRNTDVTTQPILFDTVNGNIIQWYHRRMFKNNFVLYNLAFKKDSLYSQEQYLQTINNFSRLGVWQNVNIDVKERKEKDSIGKVDMLIQLVPAKKWGFETNVEASYSANSNTNSVSVVNAGNLLGFSGNVSLQNRNLGRQGIKWTNAIRAGIELNLNAQLNSSQHINSSELSYTTTFSFPKLIPPFNLYPFTYLSNAKSVVSKQSFISGNFSTTNRIGLFKLSSLGFSMGAEYNLKKNRVLTIKLVNVEYSNLYGRTPAFDSTLAANPYLKYSYNTALVVGSIVSGAKSFFNAKRNVRSSLNVNVEWSGLFAGVIPLNSFNFLQKDLRKFGKFDIEFVHTKTRKVSETVYHLFFGAGTPFGKRDTTLPFFKQYFAGGANSMRGWPIRGIGPGIKALAPYDSRFLNDRTGDIRFEANVEYRHNLFQIIPNTLMLKWALFADLGNVWNSKNTNPGGGFDSTQFKWNIKDFYKELGLNLGTGFRFDFNYVVLRVDFGFRFKRPELTENDGWKAPSIGFNDIFQKFFKRGDNDEFRKWRYENFNFTIGLNYPF